MLQYLYNFFYYEVLYYLREMLVVAVPAAVVFLCFWPYRRRALAAMGLRTTLPREIGLVVFVMAVAGVMAVTLWPVYLMEDSPGLWGNVVLLTDRPSVWYNVNLVPLRMFTDYWKDLTHGGGFFTILNFLGNLAVFVPLGFLPALLFRKPTWRRSVLVGFGISLLVECGQYLVCRTTDIDDVILNTLGALCGYWIFLLVRGLAPNLTRKFQVEVRNGRETGDQTAAP